MDKQEKISAAIAAVMHYMQEEAILMQQAAGAGMAQMPITPPPAVTVKPWGLNGRQTQMQMRNLMQMRTFR